MLSEEDVLVVEVLVLLLKEPSFGVELPHPVSVSAAAINAADKIVIFFISYVPSIVDYKREIDPPVA